MKKFIATLVLFMSISPVAFAEVILAPQWSEFCPAEYLTVQASAISKNKTYWYNRRIQFEQAIARGAAYTGDDLKSYYDQIRQAEANKNIQWREKRLQDQEELNRLNYYNQTQSTINIINSLLNKIK